MRAICFPSGEKICAPSPELDQTRPEESHRIPSGPPLSIEAKTRPLLTEPSLATSNTRICLGLPESAIYRRDSSGENASPFGLSKSLTTATAVLVFGSKR